MNKCWKVKTVDLTPEARTHGNATTYRFHVTGENHARAGEFFSWQVPCLCCESYDLQHAKYGPGALPLAKTGRECCSVRHAWERK